MANKVWKKRPPVYHCGNCAYCGKEHLSNDGGWIINAEKKHFCHDGRNGSCFDKYVIEQKNVAEDATYEGV